MENIFLLFKTIITFFLSLIPTTYVVDFHMIDNITNVQQVIFKNDNEIIFVKDSDILNYNVEERLIRKIGKRNSNDFVGIDDEGNILLCTIEHFLIDSYDDFSTRFTVRNLKEDTEKELEFFETIRPIYMDNEKIVAVTAMDFLKQYQYLIDLNDGSMEEIDIEKKRLPVKIPEGIDVRDIYFLNRNMYVIEDIFGNLYLYKETRKRFFKEL